MNGPLEAAAAVMRLPQHQQPAELVLRQSLQKGCHQLGVFYNFLFLVNTFLFLILFCFIYTNPLITIEDALEWHECDRPALLNFMPSARKAGTRTLAISSSTEVLPFLAPSIIHCELLMSRLSFLYRPVHYMI